MAVHPGSSWVEIDSAGVTQEFWLVGHNSQGDGAERDHVTHAVLHGS